MDSVLLPRPSFAYLRPSPPGPAVGSLRQGTTRSFFRRGRAIPPLASAAVASPKIAGESVSRTVSSSPTVPLKRVSPESLHYASGYLGGISDKTLKGMGYFGANVPPTKMDYLTDILSSRVYDVAIESPLQFAPKLSHRLGVDLSLKREDLQPMFSFKLRGAYNMMAKLPKELLERGVICSSAGNHAQGVALAARKLGCEAVIVMPVTTPEIKWKSVQDLGATVVLKGDAYDEAQIYAKQRAIREDRTFVPPFDHRDVISGQGTIGLEIFRQTTGPLHAIFVPVGGGGLIAGIAAYTKSVCPEVKVIGVEPFDANAMALSLHHGERVMLERVGGFADGVAVKAVGEETFRLCRSLVDGVVLVDRDAICASMKDMFEETRSIIEPAGALSLAGAEAYCRYYGLKGEKIVAITSGANMNFDRLRLVTELADVGRRREAVLATYLHEEPGSFIQFCKQVGEMNITELKYRFDSNKKEALILYSVGIHTVAELEDMLEKMEDARFRTICLTNNDLAKDHLRHLMLYRVGGILDSLTGVLTLHQPFLKRLYGIAEMGGRSDVKNELMFRFVLPERPGVLMEFLNAFSPRWNISLFHYRSQGEARANVLVGLQVPFEDLAEFKGKMNYLGYEYTCEMNNEAYRLLMQ